VYLALIAAMASAALGTGLIASAGAQEIRDADIIPGSYIVVYKDSVSSPGNATAQREQRLGFERDYVYRASVQGFAADLSPRQVSSLESDPKVDFISENRHVEATGDLGAQANVPLAPGEPVPPTGVRRILAGTSTTVREAGANTAVLDTGIQLNHPDLNAAAGTDCINPGTPPDDGDGHGTHVAGTIGAKNNGSGVTGVAPNTKVYAVRVLDDNGDGTWASVICGVDWVTANKAAENIQVANMSLGGSGPPQGTETCATTTDAIRAAICSSTAAGVRYVVAAGNSGWDFDYPPMPDVPAVYPEVLTVTAIADSDGTPGGNGPSTNCGWVVPDDTPAPFSNFAATAAGEAHTIAAPGVCINSTVPGSTWNSDYSGTSMASPHVAGVVALCVNEAGVDGPCASQTPAQTIAHVRADAQAYNTADPDYGFAADPISDPGLPYYGFLTFTLDTTPPDTTINTGPTDTINANQATFTFAGTPASDTAKIQCRIDSEPFTDCTSPKTFTGLAEGPHTFEVRASDQAGNTDQTPATRSFTVDTTPPDTTIIAGPSGTITTNQATFTFSSNEAGSSFECGFDGSGFSPCSSPVTYPGLSDGPHRFAVRAIDEAGNTDLSETAREFTVDTTVYRAKIGKVKVKGPAKVKKGKKATYKVRVSNSGNAEAAGVKLNVKGKGVKAKKTVGTIPAGASRTVKIKLRFSKPGKVKTTFKVSSSNAGGKSVKKKITVKK
jgi:subtilisin family serine protease